MNEQTSSRRFTDVEAAKYLGISAGTLRRHRWQRTGPPYVKLGARVIYDQAELDRWIESNTVRPEVA